MRAGTAQACSGLLAQERRTDHAIDSPCHAPQSMHPDRRGRFEPGRRWPRWAWAQPGADALAATASSEWGAGYGAEAAADGIAHENGNYWQTVEKQDRDAWWQADLGQVVPVRGIKVAWACYEDKYHAPPARVIVQLSNTGGDGSWKDVLTIEADKIPADEAPFEPERVGLSASRGGARTLRAAVLPGWGPTPGQVRRLYLSRRGPNRCAGPGPAVGEHRRGVRQGRGERHPTLVDAAVPARVGRIGPGILAGRCWPKALGQGRLHVCCGRGWQTIREPTGQAGEGGGRSGRRPQRAATHRREARFGGR